MINRNHLQIPLFINNSELYITVANSKSASILHLIIFTDNSENEKVPKRNELIGWSFETSLYLS